MKLWVGALRGDTKNGCEGDKGSQCPDKFFWVYGILFQGYSKYILDILVSYEEKIGSPPSPTTTTARLELFATTFHQLVA